MKHLKRFNEAFQDTEYNKFMGIDISDIGTLTFGWTNIPHVFNSYYDKNGKLGDPELTFALNDAIKQKLVDIKREHFEKMLDRNGLLTDPNTNGGFKIVLEGRDLIDFFYIIENIDDVKNEK
jgi:hypothetical protein